MKKLLSLLGALGMLVTSASTVVACQETKKAPDDNNQKPDPNPGEPGDGGDENGGGENPGGGDENGGGNTEEPTPDPEPKEKIALSTALPKTTLGFIHIEETEKPDSSLPPEDDEAEIKESDEKAFVNIFPYIVRQLIEINGGAEVTQVNPFELYVHLPTLINNFGDMKTIVEVYNTSKTHEGQIEVSFTIDVHAKFFLQQTDLGILPLSHQGIFEMVEGMLTIKETYLFERLKGLNTVLRLPRFANKLRRKPPTKED